MDKKIPCAELVRLVRLGCAFRVVRRVVRSCARSAGWLCAGLCAQARPAQPAQGLCALFLKEFVVHNIQ